MIRAYRRIGVDLQVKVHEDMKLTFTSYPQLWRLSGPDPTNIGRGPEVEDILFRYPITGHYRYGP